MKINSIIVFLISTEGSYPDNPIVKGIIGLDKIALSNSDPYKVISINKSEYLLELFSASDTNAIIKVKKCENQTAEIINISESVNSTSLENLTEENITEENITIENTSINNESSTETKNIIEDKVSKTQSLIEIGKKFSSYWIIGIIVILFLLGVSIFLIKRKKLNELNEINELKEMKELKVKG